MESVILFFFSALNYYIVCDSSCTVWYHCNVKFYNFVIRLTLYKGLFSSWISFLERQCGEWEAVIVVLC